MHFCIRLGLIVVLVAGGFTKVESRVVNEQKWGDLQMRFVYDGPPPPPKPIVAAGFAGLVDESVIVNQQNGGIANVFVWLRSSKANVLPVHPDLKARAKAPVDWDIAGGRLDPHVSILRRDQPLTINNRDAVGYNPNIQPFQNDAFNPLLKAGNQVKHSFAKDETLPVRIGCNIHPWLSGWVLIRNDPYAATSDANGDLKIEKLPAGDWEFQFWQERAGYLEQVEWKGAQTTWTKGRQMISIKPGKNDHGTIKIGAEAFRL